MITIERTIEPIFNTLCIFYKVKEKDLAYILRIREKNDLFPLFPLYNVIEYFEGRFSDLYSGSDESKLESILTEKLGIAPF